MQAAHSLLWIKALVVGGFAGYLTLIVVNNVTAPRLNSGAVAPMMTMRALKEDPALGREVIWRAIDSPVVHRIGYLVVVLLEAVAAALLWRGAVMLIGAAAGGYAPADIQSAIGAADLGMLVFVAVAWAFVLTGLWFMSWVKMGPIAHAHTTLLVLSLLGTAVVNVGA